MFGFIRKIGCAIILLVIGAAAWHFRAEWMPKAKEIVRLRRPNATAGELGAADPAGAPARDGARAALDAP